jgi:hypothetical protein
MAYAILMASLMVVATLLVIIFTSFRSRQQTVIRKALIEKFASMQDLGEFLQTPGGKSLFEDLSTNGGSPLQSVMGSIQKGLLGLLVGLGAMLAGGTENLQPLIILGLLFACAGLAFLISAGITYRLSKSWGLLEKKN